MRGAAFQPAGGKAAPSTRSHMTGRKLTQTQLLGGLHEQRTWAAASLHPECVKGLVGPRSSWSPLEVVEPLRGGAEGEVFRPLGMCP